MPDRIKLDVKAEILPGDFGRDYVRVTIGGIEVSLYESEQRAGGVTIDVDGTQVDLELLSVTVLDAPIFPVGCMVVGCLHEDGTPGCWYA